MTQLQATVVADKDIPIFHNRSCQSNKNTIQGSPSVATCLSVEVTQALVHISIHSTQPKKPKLMLTSFAILFIASFPK